MSVKLDGCSALWFPRQQKLYTRGDGLRGRDISAFAKYFKGLPTSLSVSVPTMTVAVRGELILRSDSPAVPPEKLARNIVAGALNRPLGSESSDDIALFQQIRFVAYQLIEPANMAPSDAYQFLRSNGFEVAENTLLSADLVNAAHLSKLFTEFEAASPYKLDGIVLAPNVSRSAGYKDSVRSAKAVNPTDKVAWKTRLVAATAETTVSSVKWNVSPGGLLIPTVMFEPVVLSGATISAANGLHARWIAENGVGPGARIRVRRSGDVIPQILEVLVKAPEGPSFPPQGTWTWVRNNENINDTNVSDTLHIVPHGDAFTASLACAQLTKALDELGAEHVGPGLVAQLYAAGFTTLSDLYSASVADFTKADGIKQKGAERLYAGLRVKQSQWTDLTFLVASCCMPRGVGHTKLTPLLALCPDVTRWTQPSVVAQFHASRPAGISDDTIDEIVAAIPAYLQWRSTAAKGLTVATAAATVTTVATTATATKMVVVFTGVRDKALEASLTSNGHTVADSITKRTTHLIHADDIKSDTIKLKKARDMGISVQSLSEFKKHATVSHV